MYDLAAERDGHPDLGRSKSVGEHKARSGLTLDPSRGQRAKL
jgi:hypothetical protein